MLQIIARIISLVTLTRETPHAYLCDNLNLDLYRFNKGEEEGG